MAEEKAEEKKSSGGASAAGKGSIIIKKKKGGGHGGAHGGAWKVAYADFVTAMMAFFLVMWLMGSDEATKQAVSSYFNNPKASFFGGESMSQITNGTVVGNGESILTGAGGGDQEEKMVPKQEAVVPLHIEEHETLKALVDETFEGSAFNVDVTDDHVKFSVPGHILFQSGSSELSFEAKKYLDKLTEAFQKYPGFITIEGHTDKQEEENAQVNVWTLSFDRAMAIRNYLVFEKKISSTKLIPMAKGDQYPIEFGQSPESRQKNRRVEFIMRHTRHE